MGLIGVEQPADKGGWGKDFKSNLIGLEEQIYAGVSGGFTVQSDLVMPYIAHYGTDEQCERYMKPMRDGEMIGAIDAVFYRTYPLLYHKFGNLLIFSL